MHFFYKKKDTNFIKNNKERKQYNGQVIHMKDQLWRNGGFAQST